MKIWMNMNIKPWATPLYMNIENLLLFGRAGCPLFEEYPHHWFVILDSREMLGEGWAQQYWDLCWDPQRWNQTWQAWAGRRATKLLTRDWQQSRRLNPEPPDRHRHHQCCPHCRQRLTRWCRRSARTSVIILGNRWQLTCQGWCGFFGCSHHTDLCCACLLPKL